MMVTLNGEPRDLGSETTVAALVEALGRGSKGIAVAVNEEVVPRSAWDETHIAEGDRVEVISAAQGG